MQIIFCVLGTIWKTKGHKFWAVDNNNIYIKQYRVKGFTYFRRSVDSG